jgi:ketosteroid isomerase-like protein
VSRENVEVVRELLDLFAQRMRDKSAEGGYDPALEYYAADVEFDASRMPMVGSAGVYRGREGVSTFWREWLSAWRDLQFEVEDVLDAGENVVALIRNQRQWGRHSGIETTFPAYGIVFTIHDRTITRWRSFPDVPSALEAAGLSE